MVEQTLAGLPAGAPVWVVGENRAGGRSGGTRLDPFCSNVRKIDAARRCSLFTGTVETPPESVDLPASTTWFEIDIDEASLKLACLPGVFAGGRLDEGTAVLLEHLPAIGGRVLDFGCGCGVIGAVIARRAPTADVTLVDDFALACEASRATLAANDLRGTVLPSDGYEAVTGRFDWIVSNPPFHQGAATDYAVAESLLGRAPSSLREGARCSSWPIASSTTDDGSRPSSATARPWRTSAASACIAPFTAADNDPSRFSAVDPDVTRVTFRSIAMKDSPA